MLWEGMIHISGIANPRIRHQRIANSLERDDLMTIGSYRRNAEEPFIRVLNYNKLTPEESKTILINKNNREPK